MRNRSATGAAPRRATGVRCRTTRELTQIEALERRLQLSGTPELVLDIEPGVFDSGPASLANVNGTLFFSAKGQLWKSDGTADGTQLVKVIRPGGDAGITGITDLNG